MQKTRFHWKTTKQTRPLTRPDCNNHLTHTHAKDPVSLENHKADKATNQAALQQPSDTYTIEELDLTILKDMLQY